MTQQFIKTHIRLWPGSLSDNHICRIPDALWLTADKRLLFHFSVTAASEEQNEILCCAKLLYLTVSGKIYFITHYQMYASKRIFLILFQR